MTYLHSNYSPTLQSICLPLPLSLQKRRLWLYHKSAAHSAHLSDWSRLGFASIWASPRARHPDPFFVADCINCLCLALLGLSPPSFAAWRAPASFLCQGIPHHFPVTLSFTPEKPLCGHCSIFFYLWTAFDCGLRTNSRGAPMSHVAHCQYYVQLLNTDWA